MFTNDFGLNLDWLGFTFKPTFDLVERYGVKNYFELFFIIFPEMEKIREEAIYLRLNTLFYDSVIGIGNCFKLYYCEECNAQGVHVDISGSGVKDFVSLLGIDCDSSNYISDLMSLLFERFCKVSRIDLAFDDFEKRYTPFMYGQLFFERKIVSCFKRMNYCASTTHGEGDTFYLGTRANGKFLRIYDKNYESNGAINSIRYEFEMRSNYAYDMQLYFMDHAYLNFSEFLFDKWFYIITVSKEKASKNHSQYKDLQWFDYIRGLCKKDKFNAYIGITKHDRNKSLESFESYVCNQIMPSINTFIELFGAEIFYKNLEHAGLSSKHEYLNNLIKSSLFLERW